jgi:RHS repeat-associated protein
VEVPHNLDNRLGFAGYVWDPWIKMYHVRHRVYDPWSQRWQQPDPIGWAGGDVDFYRYANGDPLNSIDPMGLCGGPAMERVDRLAAHYTNEGQRLYHANDSDLGKSMSVASACIGSFAAGLLELPARLLDGAMGTIHEVDLAMNSNLGLIDDETYIQGSSLGRAVAENPDQHPLATIGEGIADAAVDRFRRMADGDAQAWGHTLHDAGLALLAVKPGSAKGAGTTRIADDAAGGAGSGTSPTGGATGPGSAASKSGAAGQADGAGTTTPWQTGTYGELKKGSSGTGLDVDHIPSHRSNVVRREAELGRKLTPDEIEELRQGGQSMAVPRDLHRSQSPTYGGRNNAKLQACDAADPLAAVIRDTGAYRDFVSGSSRALIEQATRQLVVPWR